MAWADGDNVTSDALNYRSGNVVNAKDPAYGATGDGSTDDLTAIQAAVDAAEAQTWGGAVWLPPARYAVSGPVVLSSNSVTLYGPGAVLLGSSLGAANSLVSISGIGNVVDGLTLDMANSATGRAIQITDATNTVIRNSRTTRTQQAFIRITGATADTWVLNNIHESKGYGVWVDDASNGRGLFVHGNEFNNSDGTGISDGVEINCPTNGFTRFVITHNYCNGQTGEASNAGLGIAVARATHGVIANNYVASTENDGIHIENNSDHVVIVGNLVRDTGVSAPVGGNGQGISVQESRSVVITGNTIHNVTKAHGIIVRGDTSGTQEFGNIIANNTIRVAGRAGIRLHAQNDFQVVNNHIIGASTETTLFFAGIETVDIAGAGGAICQDGIISGNIIRDSGSSVTAGIELQNTHARIQVSDNRLANVTFKIQANGVANHAQHDNWFSSGARRGTASLTSGVATVNTAEVVAADTIRLSNTSGVASGAGAVGSLYIDGITAGTSFIIASTSSNDESTVLWEIAH